jgi:hypothetical protein
MRWLLCGTLAWNAFLACHDGAAPTPEARATFTGRWAGRAWEGDAWAVLVPGGAAGDTLYIGGTRPVNAGQAPVESVRLRIVPPGVGTQSLGADDATLLELVGGDVISATYRTVSSGDGSVTLTSYGGVGAAVEGTVAFEAQTESRFASYGTRARFERGHFRAVVTHTPKP